MINPILIPGSPMVAVQGTFPPQTASSMSAARIVEQSDANDKADPRLGSQAASAMSSRDVRHRSRPPINISGTTLAAQSPSCDVRVAPTTPLRITSMIDTTTKINTVSRDDQCLATSAMSSRDVNHHKRPANTPCNASTVDNSSASTDASSGARCAWLAPCSPSPTSISHVAQAAAKSCVPSSLQAKIGPTSPTTESFLFCSAHHHDGPGNSQLSSIEGSALDGLDSSPLDPATLDGKRGWPLKSALDAPLGSTLDGLGRSLLGSAFDGPSSSPLMPAHNGLNSVPLGSKLDSSSSNTLLGSALDVVSTSTLSSTLGLAPDGSPLGSALNGLGGSMLSSALDGLECSVPDGLGGPAISFVLEDSAHASAPDVALDGLTLGSALGGIDRSSPLEDFGNNGKSALNTCLVSSAPGSSPGGSSTCTSSYCAREPQLNEEPAEFGHRDLPFQPISSTLITDFKTSWQQAVCNLAYLCGCTTPTGVHLDALYARLLMAIGFEALHAIAEADFEFFDASLCMLRSLPNTEVRDHILWFRPLAPTKRASSCRLMCPNTDDILRHSQRLASLCHQSEHLHFATVELWQQMNASTCICADERTRCTSIPMFNPQQETLCDNVGALADVYSWLLAEPVVDWHDQCDCESLCYALFMRNSLTSITGQALESMQTAYCSRGLGFSERYLPNGDTLASNSPSVSSALTDNSPLGSSLDGLRGLSPDPPLHGSTFDSVLDDIGNSTLVFTLDGSKLSSALDGGGGSMLSSAPDGFTLTSALGGSKLGSALNSLGDSGLCTALDSLDGSALDVALNSSTLGSSVDGPGSLISAMFPLHNSLLNLELSSLSGLPPSSILDGCSSLPPDQALDGLSGFMLIGSMLNAPDSSGLPLPSTLDNTLDDLGSLQLKRACEQKNERAMIAARKKQQQQKASKIAKKQLKKLKAEHALASLNGGGTHVLLDGGDVHVKYASISSLLGDSPRSLSESLDESLIGVSHTLASLDNCRTLASLDEGCSFISLDDGRMLNSPHNGLALDGQSLADSLDSLPLISALNSNDTLVDSLIGRSVLGSEDSLGTSALAALDDLNGSALALVPKHLSSSGSALEGLCSSPPSSAPFGLDSSLPSPTFDSLGNSQPGLILGSVLGGLALGPTLDGLSDSALSSASSLPSSTFNSLGNSQLGSMLGSALGGSALSPTLDGLIGSALGSALSFISSAPDSSALGSALAGSALGGSALSPTLNGLSGSALCSAPDSSALGSVHAGSKLSLVLNDVGTSALGFGFLCTDSLQPLSSVSATPPERTPASQDMADFERRSPASCGGERPLLQCDINSAGYIPIGDGNHNSSTLDGHEQLIPSSPVDCGMLSTDSALHESQLLVYRGAINTSTLSRAASPSPALLASNCLDVSTGAVVPQSGEQRQTLRFRCKPQQARKSGNRANQQWMKTSVTLPLTLPFPPRLGHSTSEYVHAERAFVMLQAGRKTIDMLRKRKPTAHQCYVARAILRARDARWALLPSASAQQIARVEVLEHEAREMYARLSKHGVLEQPTAGSAYISTLEAEASRALLEARGTTKMPPAVPQSTITQSTDADVSSTDLAACAVEWLRANVILAELLPPQFRTFQGDELVQWVTIDFYRVRTRPRFRPTTAHTLPEDLVALLRLPSLIPVLSSTIQAECVAPCLKYTQPVSGMPANGTPEFAIECAKMKAVEDAQRAALSTAKLKASQLHQTALLETAQRRNDVAAASENIATGVVTLSSKPSHDLRLIAANGAYVDLEKLDLTQDLFLVLCAISGTGIDLELGFIHKLRSMGVSFDARAHHARQVARHLHVGIPTPIELCKMRADELIAAAREARVQTRGRRQPTGRPNIGSKAARNAMRHRAATPR